MRLFCPLSISDFPLWSISGEHKHQMYHILHVSTPGHKPSVVSECKIKLAGSSWFMPVILATQEAVIRKIMI
jgi:hypothetical protein